jgi:hypothetical protein
MWMQLPAYSHIAGRGLAYIAPDVASRFCGRFCRGFPKVAEAQALDAAGVGFKHLEFETLGMADYFAALGQPTEKRNDQAA